MDPGNVILQNPLKELRISKNLTQVCVAKMLGVSLRSYKSYENDRTKENSVKYKYFIQTLQTYNPLDEDHGILTQKQIADGCAAVFREYPVKYCILFGSYAKGIAGESSDVDLLISADISGLRFFGLVEQLRKQLHKRVDVLDLKQLNNNTELTDEILKDGIRIYEQCEN